MPNSGFTLARRLRAGETIYSGWCGLPSPLVTEIVARGGMSAVVIDGQHGLWDTATTVAAVAAIRHGGASPIVRVGFNEFSAVSRALDFGAEAVIAPMINTAEDAGAFAAAAKFPPMGERSWGPHRAATLGGMPDPKDYLREANALTLTLAMIETREAIKNVDAIAAVPGIDMLFIGPSDLSITLSDGAMLDPHSRAVDDAIDTIVKAARKAGKLAGLFCINAERAVTMATRGLNFLTIGTDINFLNAGMAAQVRTLKG